MKLRWPFASVLSSTFLISAFLTLSSVSLPSEGYAASAPKVSRPTSTSSQSSIDPFLGKTIRAIEIKGLKRIEKEAVLAKLASKAGQDLSKDQVREDIQSIFKMGFFDDIETQAEAVSGGINLSYVIRERPVITKIEFEGNERITTSDLKDVVKVKEFSILDVNKVREDVALIQKHYEDKGFYLAKVSFDVKPTKPDEVELIYRVNDYEKVQIKKITFLNNKHFNDDQLRNVLQETKEGGLFSFMNSSGNFKESAFKQDLQRLTYWYLDHGFVKFRYENPVVTVSDDKRYLYVSIYLEEGEKYAMGPIDFGGDLLFSKEELKKDLQLTDDQTFSISKRNFDIQHLSEKYQDLGYAFVNVIPKMNIHDDSKKVDVEYDFEKGNLVYFGEINILGNSKTHDKVIRRELKIKEGELYSGSRLRESRENVERLGYFAPGEVIFNTVSPKGKQDVLNVEVTVKERSTGTITLGAGYGSVQGFFFQTQVAEINLLGRGQNLTLTAQLAADQGSKSFNLGFTDPFAWDTQWSTGFDLYYVNFPIPYKYTQRKRGADIRVGHALWEFTNAYITYKLEGTNIYFQADQSPGNFDKKDIEADTGVLSSVVWSLVRDKRNNRFETTDGNYQSASLESAGVWGDKKFLKWILNNRYYKRITGDLVFRNSLEFGQMNEIAGKPLPPSERFFLGGPNNLRGYSLFSIGPSRFRNQDVIDQSGKPVPVDPNDPSKGNQRTSIREPVGGSTEMLALFELEYPLIREAGLKAVAFYDAGNVFGRFPQGDEWTIRTDAGLGFRWFSPIGPLRFEWGFPFRRKPGEDESVFQFFIGPPF